MRRTLVGVFGVVVVLLLTDAGSSLASFTRVGACYEDEGLQCEASGRVRYPHRLTMTVRSRPRGTLSGDWTTVCFNNWSGRECREGYFTNEETPIRKRLPIESHGDLGASYGETKLLMRALV